MTSEVSLNQWMILSWKINQFFGEEDIFEGLPLQMKFCVGRQRWALERWKMFQNVSFEEFWEVIFEVLPSVSGNLY